MVKNVVIFCKDRKAMEGIPNIFPGFIDRYSSTIPDS
jgi:hypothetical protein